MFSPIREHLRNPSFPYKDKEVLMASPDDVSYSAVKIEEIYFTNKRIPHSCTVLGKMVISPRVLPIATNIDSEIPKMRIATDYGNIWHLPQKYIDGKSTFVLYDYWDAIIVLISSVS